jgi:hypothetical protein
MRIAHQKLMMCALAIASVLALDGRGIARRQEMEAKRVALKQQSDAAFQDCNTQFPPGKVATAVARAQCTNNALSILRPILPYPDLWDVYMASHIVIAERVQKGQISIAEANEVLAQKRSDLAPEEQRRLLANRSVAAQENIASASLQAAGPHSCFQASNTVTCF